MSEENIFSEVDEELRSERMRNLWRKFAPWVFGAIILIILAVAGKEVLTWYKNDISATSSDQFYAAVEMAEDGDIAGAQLALSQVISDGSGQYPILAQFRVASLLLEDGKVKEAIAAYDALSASLSNQRLRELALVFAAFALVDNSEVSEVEGRVSGLLGLDNPFRNIAREAIGLSQFANNDINAARQTLELIALDPFANNESMGRVQIYIAQLISLGAEAPQVISDSDPITKVQ